MSPSIIAADPDSAWAQLIAKGWSLYVPERSARGYPLCPKCTATPWSLEQAAEGAKKARKRR